MKRFSLLLLTLLPMLLYAGVIMKRSGETISDVVIQNITDTEIIYTTADGAEQTISKSDASAVLYDDGRYVEIKQIETNHSVQNATSEQNQVVYQDMGGDMVVEPPVDPYLEYRDGLIHRLGANKYYYVDSLYSSKEIKSIILSCPDARRQYDNARKWIIGGWSGVFASAAMITAGSILTAIGVSNENQHVYVYDEWGYGHYEWQYNDDAYGMTVAGAVILSTGCAGVVSSFVIACIGHARMNNTCKIYNQSCASTNEPPMELSFGPTRNGIGLTFNF